MASILELDMLVCLLFMEAKAMSITRAATTMFNCALGQSTRAAVERTDRLMFPRRLRRLAQMACSLAAATIAGGFPLVYRIGVGSGTGVASTLLVGLFSTALATCLYAAMRAYVLRAFDEMALRLGRQSKSFEVALDNVSQGVCFFDEQQRLVLANPQYAEIYSLPLSCIQPGTTLRQIAAARVVANSAPDMSPEEYLHSRQFAHNLDRPSDSVIELRNGRVISIHHRPMPGPIDHYTTAGAAPALAVGRGEVLVGITFQHDLVDAAKHFKAVRVVSPCEGTGFEIGSISIVKGARHPEEARVFYDWALTPGAQVLAAQNGSYQVPSNTATPVPPEAPDMAHMKLIDYDFAKFGSATERARLLSRWTREVKNGG